MSAEDWKTKQVSIQLFQFPSVFCWLVFELHTAIMECCGLLAHLPLPKLIVNHKSDWGCQHSSNEPCDCWSTFGDYYGDDWGSLWHCFLDMPLEDYLNRRFQKSIRQYQFVDVPISEWSHQTDDPDINWIRDDIEREKMYPVDAEGNSTVPTKDLPGETWLYKLMEWLTRPWRTELCDGTRP